MPPIINEEKCIGCTRCANIWTRDVFGPAEPKKVPAIRYPDECWHCRACIMECPVGAIEMRYPLPYMLLNRKAK